MSRSTRVRKVVSYNDKALEGAQREKADAWFKGSSAFSKLEKDAQAKRALEDDFDEENRENGAARPAAKPAKSSKQRAGPTERRKTVHTKDAGYKRPHAVENTERDALKRRRTNVDPAAQRAAASKHAAVHRPASPPRIVLDDSSLPSPGGAPSSIDLTTPGADSVAAPASTEAPSSPAGVLYDVAPAPRGGGARAKDAPRESEKSFNALMDEFRKLERKYRALKEMKIQEVEDIMQEQSKNIEKHSQATRKLATHWREEAERQAALAAGAAEAKAALVAVTDENGELKQSLLESEAKAAALEQALVDLERRTQAAEAAAANADARVAAAETRAAQAEHAGAAPALQGDPMGSLELLTGLRAFPAGCAIRYEDSHTGMAFELHPGDPRPAANGMELEDEVKYVPCSLGSAGKFLPSFLRDEIVFSLRQMPQFMQRILPGVIAGRGAAAQRQSVM
ncbi:unnamed protein product [Pedinophyceae sp. YPF-701]|nr:unnamed protein product [Pedinophyceae sp. YPF-701]